MKRKCCFTELSVDCLLELSLGGARRPKYRDIGDGMQHGVQLPAVTSVCKPCQGY
jgi:hypothetical protein